MLATMSPMAITLIFLSSLMVISINVVRAQPSKIPSKPALYVFGDSLYDTGSGLYIAKGPSANADPYGMTYFKRPKGRFSDGRLIPDFLAEFVHLPLLEPYWNPKLKDYTQSVNFANAAAGILVETRPNTLNLELQTQYFVQMTNKLKKQYGKGDTKKLLSNAVYLFNIGANDYTDLYQKNKKPLSTSLKTQFMNKVIGNFSMHLTTIYKKGGRKFGFQASAPMGCLPQFRLADGSCTEERNTIAREHNARLETMCKSLATQLPGFKYSIYNFYSSLSARLSNGARYGFTDNKSACCGSGRFNGQFSCGKKKYNFTVCKDPTKYLWFDAGHPTQKADYEFAQEFWSGSSNLVAPYNIRSFFQ